MSRKKAPDPLLIKVKSGFREKLNIWIRIRRHHGIIYRKGTEERPYFSEYEYGQTVKLFVNAENRKRKSALPTNAKEMWLYIQDVIDYRKEWIWIDKARYLLEMDVKDSTYRSAIRALVKHEFLEKTPFEEVYIFDPRLVWKGDRGAFFEERTGHFGKKEDMESFAKAFPGRTFGPRTAMHTEFDTPDEGSDTEPVKEI